jgi:hypothetical protein
MGASAGTYNLLRAQGAAVPATGAEAMVTADRQPRVVDAGRDHPRRHEHRDVLAHTGQALVAPGTVVLHAIPQTTTVSTRGAAPSCPVS